MQISEPAFKCLIMFCVLAATLSAALLYYARMEILQAIWTFTL